MGATATRETEKKIMFRYQVSLLLSCTLAMIMFYWVRLRNSTQDLTVTRVAAALGRSVRQTACLNQPPYTTVAFDHQFILCGGHTDLTVPCPPPTVFNPATKQCEEVDPCFHHPDGARIVTAYSPHLPKNRSYHICKDRAISETRLCPDHEPLFDGAACVASNSCAFLEDGDKYADPLSDTRYYRCENRTAVLHACPPDHEFVLNHCVRQDICDAKENGVKFPYPGDATRYYKCANKKALKRKCPTNLYFSEAKQACLAYHPCNQRGGATVPIDTPYLLRSHRAFRCDEQERATEVVCPFESEIYDEETQACRALDPSKDIKPGKIFPLTDHSYLSPERPGIHQVRIDERLDAGERVNRCRGLADGTVLGPHPSADLPVTFVTCHQQVATVQACPPRHLFVDGACEFWPCHTQPEGTGGLVPLDPRSFYYCKRGMRNTYRVTCPEGTVPAPTHDRCVPDPDYEAAPFDGPPPFRTRSTRETYFDAGGKLHTCPDDLVVNPWNVTCQEEPCTASTMTNVAFVPTDATSGVFCVRGRVKGQIRCPPGTFFNLQKTLTGDYISDACVADPPRTRVLERDGTAWHFTREQLHAVEDDDFAHRDLLQKRAETISEGLEAVVGPRADSWPDPASKKNPCGKTKIGRATVPGYPHLYYDCKTRKLETVGTQHVAILNGKNERIFPIFSDCGLFAIGRDAQRHRVFKCPNNRPYFSYALKVCVEHPPVGTLLCGNYFHENLEAYASPEDYTLPAPIRLSDLAESSPREPTS